MNWSTALQVQLRTLASEWSAKHNVPSYQSIGPSQVVLFECADDGGSHGNFHPSTWEAILASPEWSKRTQKTHTRGSALPEGRSGRAKELDSSNSSDALLMNCFCYPGASTKQLAALGIVPQGELLEFGYKAEVPLVTGGSDKTEVDMKIGNVLFEAKLTETSFTSASPDRVEKYVSFVETFHHDLLPRAKEDYLGYQLIRNVLAARHHGASLVVLIDARRPDLLQEWWGVHSAIVDPALRSRCHIRTWQEVAAGSPAPLREFLAERYGL